MDRVFISYAREDLDFVQRLCAALEARGRKVWVDWEGIPPSDKWLATIRAAIDAADAVIFVISPDSVASQVCRTELDHATGQHKRLVPLLHRDPGAGAVPAELAELNYVFARAEDPVDAACDQLVAALDTDLPWVRAHTRLLVRATEWEGESRDASFTLRGRDLNEFEEWMARSPEKEPPPTALQAEYLLASRRAVTRRQRVIGTSVAVGLSIAVGLGTIAFFQNRERVRQEAIAGARQLLNLADALREGPADEEGARGRLESSTRSAATALATLHGLGVPSLEADQSVRRSYAALPKWVDIDLGPSAIQAAGFDATGRRLAVFQSPGEFMVRDVARREESGACSAPLGVGEAALAIGVSADGAAVATAVYDASPGRGDTEITVWSLPECTATQRIRLPGRIDRLALGGDGRHLAAGAGSTLRLWDLAGGAELHPGFGDVISAFAFSPAGDRLATAGRNRGERTYRLRVHDLAGGGEVREWAHPERAAWIQWNPGAILLGGQSAWLYDPASGELLRRHPLDGRAFALSGDGSRIAVSLPDYTLEIADAATGETVARTSYDGEVAELAFGPDGQTLTTVNRVDRNIRVWTFAGDAAFATLEQDTMPARVGFTGDGTYLYTQGSRGELRWRLPAPGERTVSRSAERSPQGATTAASYRVELPEARGCSADPTTVTVRSARPDGSARTLTMDGTPLTVVVSDDGARVAALLATGSTRGGCDRRLVVAEVASGATVASRELDPVLDGLAAGFLRLIGDYGYLAVGVRTGIEIVDAERLTPVATLFHHGVRQAAIRADGSVAATQGEDGVVRVWQLPDVSEIARVQASPTTADLALSPDGRWLATIEPPGAVRLWAIAPEDLIRQVCAAVPEPCP